MGENKATPNDSTRYYGSLRTHQFKNYTLKEDYINEKSLKELGDFFMEKLRI